MRSEPYDSGVGKSYGDYRSLRLYLEDINDIPRLSREEEIELAKRMQRGDEDAKTKIIESYLPLVISIAKRYRNCGLPFSDLIQEGNIGLIYATSNFDYRKARFTTYATSFIRQAIIISLAKQDTIQLPIRKIRAKRKIERWTNSRHEICTPKEISQGTGLSLKDVKKISATRIEVYSLDNDTGDLNLVHEVEDTTERNRIREYAQRREQEEFINQLLSTLSDKERRVMEMRYGVNGNSPMSLRKTGKTLDLSHERIRQIQLKAESKLRKCAKRTRIEAQEILIG